MRRSNRAVASVLVGIVGAMAGLAFASVPLYQWFCEATGFGGTPRTNVAGGSGRIGDREIEVRFDANVAGGLPWSFEPERRSIRIRLGEETEVRYRARNASASETAGTSTFNVVPHSMGRHFVKIECFCFTEQRLMPGAEAALPVRFYVDPEIGADRGTRDVTTVTLSYTFFPLKGGAAVSPTGNVAALGAPVVE